MDDGEQQRSPSQAKNADTLACDCGFGKAKNFKKMGLRHSKNSKAGALLAAHPK
jgi:hypothetical protein